MSKDKELEIQMQFLEEATDYINTLEGVLLEIDTSHRIDLEKMNAALRAAHSIKGGAAMMGFRALSDLSHRLEDAFKVLKTRKNSLEIDTQLQSLLLSAVDWLRQIVELLGEGNAVEEDWLTTFCHPVFDELRDRLGEPSPEDAATMLSPEEGQDIVPLLFETEVEGCLQRLESVLADKDQPCLQEEVAIMAAELGGLGEMLQLTAFTQLCESIKYHIENANGNITEIAQLALQTWRRSQALVLTNQRDSLPTKLQFGEVVNLPVPTLSLPPQEIEETPEIFIENELIAEDFTAIDQEINHDLAIIEFPDFLTEFAKENTITDYTLTNNKDREYQENTVRVPSKQLEQINDLFGELIIQRNGLNSQIEKLRKLVRNLNQRVQTLERENQELRTINERKISKTLVNAHSGGEYPKESEFDALEMDRYNELNLRSQTLTETIVQVQEVTTDIQLGLDDTDHVARKLNKTSKQLQTKLNHIRMRPMSDLVERFPRAIRDLNVEYGKSVQLKITGGNTLIERSILEALNEPLMHLLRNAFDHGIEEPATRQALGKPEQGLIEITATHRSNRTIITMRDDGRGIALDKIRTRAQAMGIDATLLTNATDEELLSLIFEPGFSTSEKVTSLSGRGVGMDVVRNNLKLVRGDITVDTEPGVGTTFTLSVPFTLSIARVLLVETNKMLLAFPTDVVTELFILQNEQVFPMAGNEVLNWQGSMLPLIRLSRHLEFNCPRYDSPELETPPAINAHSVLIVKGNNQPVAILVDRCWGEQEVAIRQVEGNIPLPQGFNNCTILGDGRVVALVNINELLYKVATNQRPAKNHQSSATLKTPFLFFDSAKLPQPPTSNKGTILIIDDSINVRRFLALTLEKGGYQVEQAKDGEDAWEKLEHGLKVQAVICDIEMPRLDGYGFLDRINSHFDTKKIPVAMLTSRSSNKHRQLAMQLGARAYFSKPYNEQELLGTLEEIISNVVVTATSN
ncbi:hybrid sensor histidine kinase/response regulator [Nostoc sp. MS1]|uniref:hybrid sensor histidine kinase/response regulator n=1 Tax=Nostoc sp. MS1 TaxID=2764711 RepID=UPI001CC5AF59|nr:hybrid sensor histidine kinase/response regulator [Nostoc sp. MS1]BCL34316.1 hybrid sensor histidine kinase/response regulator [Nostoc sp. MS1]